MPEDTTAVSVACPICGSASERGAIYASDRGPIRWLPGKPSGSKNWDSFCGEGAAVGEWQFWAGVFAEGIRCRKCARIIIEEKKEPIQQPQQQRP